MKTRKVLLCVVLCMCLIVSGFSFAFADNNVKTTYMQQTVEQLGERLDGEKMFDYLSYVYYNGVDSLDDLWKWITKTDVTGNRVNVLNG